MDKREQSELFSDAISCLQRAAMLMEKGSNGFDPLQENDPTGSTAAMHDAGDKIRKLIEDYTKGRLDLVHVANINDEQIDWLARQAKFVEARRVMDQLSSGA
jgi:hypothetical protein